MALTEKQTIQKIWYQRAELQFFSFAVESALKPNKHFEVDVVLKDPRNKRFAWNEKLVEFQSSTF